MQARQHAGVMLVAAAAGLSAGAPAARAQPALTPPGGAQVAPAPAPTGAEDEREDGPKSPGTALAWSLGGTAAAIGMMAVGGAMNANRPEPTPVGAALSTVGGLGMWVAPSFGHWYAGRYWTTGLKVRLVGLLVGVGGAVGTLTCSYEENADDCVLPLLVIGAGASMIIGGAVYDVATAPREARRYNARAAASGGWISQVQLTPTLVGPAGGRGAGLSLAGAF